MTTSTTIREGKDVEDGAAAPDDPSSYLKFVEGYDDHTDNKGKGVEDAPPMMMMGADLDDALLDRILRFVNEPKARPCCKNWATTLYDSLSLGRLISFKKYLRSRGGKFPFHHTAVRHLGDEFEECATYQFEFFESGQQYQMQWCRNFDAWSAQNERQVGVWSVVNGHVRCETTEAPDVTASSTTTGSSSGGGDRMSCPGLGELVPYASAGRVFEIPIEMVLSEHSKVDDQVLPWERPSRGLVEMRTTPELDQIVDHRKQQEDYQGGTHHHSSSGNDHVMAPQDTAAVLAEEARYVDIDGELHEVSKDIQDNYPEPQWERLMRCRVRFGING